MKTISNRVRAGAVTGAGAIVLFTGCGAPDEGSEGLPASEEVGVVGEDLIRGTDFGSGCTDDDKAVFRQAMILGRTLTQTPALAQCVDLVMRTGDTSAPDAMGPYHFCSGDQFPGSSLNTQISKVQALLKSTNRVFISDCLVDGRTSVTAPGDRHDYTFSGDEKFSVINVELSSIRDVEFSTNYNGLDDLVAGRVTLILRTTEAVWHEAMHTHGYEDDQAKCGGGDNARNKSVTYMVGHCVTQVAERSAAQCDMLDCPKSGYIKLVNSYPVTGTTTCGCYRDTSVVPATDTEQLPTLVQDVNEAEDLFGSSMASGDFNGDGFDDLAVGAPGEDNDTGAVYLYYGSAFGLAPAQGPLGSVLPGQIRDILTLSWGQGGVAGDLFGKALAAADFNQDGVDDLAIGAPGKNGRGAVFLYRGRRDGLFRTERFLSPSPGAGFGFSLATGHFRSDRIPSLAVGAPGAGSRGAVYVYQGQESAETPLLFWSTLQPILDAGARFGASVAIGPSNRSFGALAVGAPGYPNGGRVFVYDGSVPVNGSPSYSVGSPNQETQAFGSAVALGNVGGGGLAVGAPFHSNASVTWLGAVHYFTDNRTSSGGSVTFHYTQEGPSSGALFGWSMNLLDIDDLLVGAPNESGGRVHRYRNGPVGNDLRAVEQSVISQGTRGTNEPEDSFGFALAVGDFDGNDFVDIAIGAAGEAPGSDPASGAVFVRRRTETGNWVAGAVVTQAD
jgi:hypothetical protein